MVNVHFTKKQRESHVIVTLCDIGLLGKTLKFKDVEFHISEKFYGGKIIPIDAAINALDQATMANLIGKDSVSHAIKAGYIHEDAVLWIGDIPHAQWLRL